MSAGMIISLLFISSFLSAHKCWSKVNLSKTEVLVMPQDVSEPLMTAETSLKILPQKLEPNESGSQVISKMADNSFGLWWDNTPLRNTTVGQAADTVEKKMKAEVTFQDSSEQKTEHKVSFKILAMQTLAKLEYSGWIKAALNYDARLSKTEAEISEKFFLKEDIVVSHAVTPAENRSQVSLRFGW